ncbi:MAG: hypothetical protein KC561_07780, partial [Myxococcales bacterium]|nr:hypothetical protein [Myxococcales bacterium]
SEVCMTCPVRIERPDATSGGSCVRSAASIAVSTGRPVQLTGEPERGGLKAEGLSCLQAIAEIAPGTVLEGAEIGSDRISISPKAARAGRFSLDAGPSGSVALVLQTVLLPLIGAGGRSLLTIRGVTHAKRAPSFEWLRHVWSFWLEQMGIRVELELRHAAFEPRSDGEIRVLIEPSEIRPMPVGEVRSPKFDRIQLIGLRTPDVSRPFLAGQLERLSAALRSQPKLVGPLTEIHSTVGEWDAKTQGGATVLGLLESDCCRAGIQRVWLRRDEACDLSEELGTELLSFLEAGGGLDPYAADQLMLPLAGASGPSAFETSVISTQIERQRYVIERFGLAEAGIAGNSVQINPVGF